MMEKERGKYWVSEKNVVLVCAECIIKERINSSPPSVDVKLVSSSSLELVSRTSNLLDSLQSTICNHTIVPNEWRIIGSYG